MAEQQASAAVPAALQKETISISAPAHDSGVKPEDAKPVGPKNHLRRLNNRLLEAGASG